MNAWTQVLKSWQNKTFLQIMSLSILSLSISAIFSVLLIAKNTKNIFNKWSENIEITIYLSENSSESDWQQIQSFLDKNDWIEKSQFVSKKQAKEKFQVSLSEYAPELKDLEDIDNPFPNTIEAKLSLATGIENVTNNLSKFAKQIEALSGVEEVSWGKQWLEKYSKFFLSFKNLSLLLVLIVIAASLFIVANSIRSSIEDRRNEIEILELVGATKSMVRKPFILEALVLTSLALASAFAMSYASYYIVSEKYSNSFQLLGLSQGIVFFSFVESIFLLASIIAAALLTSYICVKNINTGWAASAS